MNIKFWFKQTVREGYIIPLHLGVAYRDPMRNEAVCYLVPFNWVVRITRYTWMIIRIPTWNQFERSYGNRILNMRRESFEEGLHKGFVDGYMTKMMDLYIPVKYSKDVSERLLAVQQQFRRGMPPFKD